MRIALVHYTYLPVIAGVELIMAGHVRLLARAGHEVTVVTMDELRSSPEPGRDAKAGLRETLAGFDVVILHNVMTMPFHPGLTTALWELAEELTSVRFVCWIHDLAACNPDYASQPLDERLSQAHPRMTYVAVSELRRRQFLAVTAQPPDRCRTIPNGVDPTRVFDLPPRVSEFVRQNGVLDREIVLLHPARLLRRKNVELTLQVTAALRAAGRTCAALITAPPEIHHPASQSYETELRALRERLDIAGDAHFLHDGGPLLDHELRGLFALADALFFPSRQEGFGLPLVEAALHRLPVFCAQIEPFDELPAGNVTPFSLDATPEEIAALIVRTLDANPAASARREALQRYSWDAIDRNFLSPLLAELETR